MNGKDLLTELGNIHEKFYMEAENDTLPASPRIRRPLLLAALIALMLLLVGCGVVYMLKMQNLKLGQSQVTEQRWDKEQHTMVEQTLSQQTLTLSGLKGTPSYQAAQEWYEFEQTYDPNHEIINSIWGNIPEFPEKYDFYSPYSQEMVDKIDGICSKYNLKLIDNPVAAQNTRVLLEYLGIDSILLPDAPAQASVDTASYYEVGYFYTDITFQMTEGEDAWPFQSLLSYIYCPKDCFNNELYHLTGDDWQERNYLTKSGREVLILRSPSNWASWVFCDVGDATVALRLETIHQVGTDQNGYQEVIETPMTEEQLNQILDTVNFNLELHPGDPSILEGQKSSTDLSQTQNGYTVEVKQVITDGMQVSVTLGVTAPEDVDLEQYLAEVGSDTYISFYSLRFTLPKRTMMAKPTRLTFLSSYGEMWKTVSPFRKALSAIYTCKTCMWMSGMKSYANSTFFGPWKVSGISTLPWMKETGGHWNLSATPSPQNQTPAGMTMVTLYSRT